MKKKPDVRKKITKGVEKMEAIDTKTPTPDIPNLPDKNLLRVSEAAEYFGVHERTIRLWIEHGKLKAEKLVGTVFISRESIKNFRLLSRPM